MKLALSLPFELDDDDAVIDMLTANDFWDGLEISGAALDAPILWDGLLESGAIPPMVVYGLLPGRIARYLPETDAAARNQLIAHVRRGLEKAGSCRIRYATLDFGIERIAGGGASAMQDRVALLKSLLPLAKALEITTCVPLRLPSAMPGQDLVAAGVQLVNEVMHPCCQLMFNVFPEDLPADFDPAPLLKQYHFNLALLRFIYEPALGIRPGAELQKNWAAALRWRGFKGAIVFAPKVESIEQLAQECGRLRDDVEQHWRG